MKSTLLLLPALLLMGCAVPKTVRRAAEGTQQIQAATVSVEKARAAQARARESLSGGRLAVAELRRTATPAQRPYVLQIESSLAAAARESEVMRVNLEEMAPRLVAAQASMDALGAQLFRAEMNARGYRRLKLWLSFFACAGAAYVAYRMVPPIGPARYYAAAIVGLSAGGGAYLLL